jgi:cation diffusion facilitator family transporter
VHTDSLDSYRHEHVFLGADHARNERKTWTVIVLCATMMVAEIGGGALFGSMVLVADGLHMSTHAAALLIAALAYTFARRHARDPRFAFGTGKFGDLAGFTSALVLAMIALLIAWESSRRLLHPVSIAFDEALLVAALGLVVNLLSAFLLRDEPHAHAHHGTHDHAKYQDGHEHDDAHERSHEHEHGHDHGHAHQDAPTHDHAHGETHDHPARRRQRDLNLRAAYVHVLADAAVSVLAIVGLGAGKLFGWVWMDPVMALVGAVVIARWSWTLLRATGGVLLDAQSDTGLAEEVLRRLEKNGDRVSDLHLWRVGPGHTAAIASIVSDAPAAPAVYKARLADLPGLSHITVEVVRCPGDVPQAL